MLKRAKVYDYQFYVYMYYKLVILSLQVLILFKVSMAAAYYQPALRR